MEEIKKHIELVQTEIRLQTDSLKRQDLQKQLKKLQLNLEIEGIKKRIEQLG